jgi:hypothetical protein
MRKGEPYVQRLPDLELSIERNSPRTPPDDWFYVIRSGSVVDRFRTLAKARNLWNSIVEESGWTSKPRKLTPAEMLARETAARERFEKEEHWTRVRRRS